MEFYVVIDTNVFVSALLTQNKSSATVRILDYLEKGVIIPMYNEDIIKEYSEVLRRMKFDIEETRIQDLLAAIKSRGIDCGRISSDVLLPDPDDIVFYEVSLSRDDSYLVTGNLRHFPKNGKIVYITRKTEGKYSELSTFSTELSTIDVPEGMGKSCGTGAKSGEIRGAEGAERGDAD